MFYYASCNSNRIKLIAKQIRYAISFLSFEWQNSEKIVEVFWGIY